MIKKNQTSKEGKLSKYYSIQDTQDDSELSVDFIVSQDVTLENTPIKLSWKNLSYQVS